jgi:Flp pilus assembly protein TadB
VARLPGDPGVLRWLRFAAGFRLPAENRDWVKHELTDAGWRGRTVLRHLAVIVPICVVLIVVLAALVPAPLWMVLAMAGLILCGSIFSVAAYADDLRVSRMRQHGLEPPDDPDLGHPAH